MSTSLYIVPRTSDPAEHALAAAENACRVPLEDAEGARFLVLEYIAAALDALDHVGRFDHVTRDMVRERIGRAQARANWQ